MSRRLPVFALLASTTLSVLAEAISMVAIPWFVLDLTGSYADMGIVGFFTFAPRVVAIFFGGQVIDRIGFRAASVASDLLSGISACGIPILHAMGHLTFPWLIALVVTGAFFDGPGATAKDAMAPELADAAGISLDRVNAFFQSARRLSLFIGPALAGFMVALTGPASVLWLNAVAFGISAIVTVALIPAVTAEPLANDAPESFWTSTVFGFRYLRQHRLLLWLAGTICLMNLLDAPLTTVQLPALVRENYGSAGRLGLMLSAYGAGAVAGGLLYSVVAPRLSRRKTFAAGCFAVALVFLVLALAPPYALAMTAMVIMGLAGGPLNPILMSIRQERVPLPYRARVFGTITAIAWVAIPLGQLGGGYLVEWLGVNACLAGVAIAYLAVVAAYLINPVFHEMDRTPAALHTSGQAAPGA